MRARLLKARPAKVEEIELPNGDVLNFRVLSFHDVGDVLARLGEVQEEGMRAERIEAVGRLVVQSICDQDGNAYLQDGDHEALFKAMDTQSYVTLAMAVQRAYGLIPIEEVVEDLSEAPGAS